LFQPESDFFRRITLGKNITHQEQALVHVPKISDGLPTHRFVDVWQMRAPIQQNPHAPPPHPADSAMHRLLPDEILALVTHLRTDQAGMDEKQAAQRLLRAISLMEYVGLHLEQT
jgi:hypothetical protein